MEHSTQTKLKKIFDGSPPVTGADRAWALRLVGSTQAELARTLGISKTVVHRVLHDLDNSRRVATTLGQITGLSLQRLWPCGKYSKVENQRKDQPPESSRKQA